MERWAAKPRTTPARPAEARMLIPSFRSSSKLIKIEARERTRMTVMAIFFKTFTWVYTFLAWRLSLAVMS